MDESKGREQDAPDQHLVSCVVIAIATTARSNSSEIQLKSF
jgi:hypothetical protein